MENSIYHKKSVDELTFTDDGMFQQVLRDPEICAELVERLLHIKVNHIEYPELEKQIKPFYSTKGVRLDVYLKDEDKIIDVELQSYLQSDLGKRTRYYQSMIDMDCLMKGQDYTELKDSYILFICKDDPFRSENQAPAGLPCYTFRNICEEDSGVKLNDKSIKVLYNASAYEQEKDKRIRNFLHFICTNEPGDDDFSCRLSTLVETIKENEEFRSDYAAMNLHDRDLIRISKADGKKEGKEEKALEDAVLLVKKYGATPETAAQDMKVNLEKLLEVLDL